MVNAFFIFKALQKIFPINRLSNFSFPIFRFSEGGEGQIALRTTPAAAFEFALNRVRIWEESHLKTGAVLSIQLPSSTNTLHNSAGL